jgi:hypothetical protein
MLTTVKGTYKDGKIQLSEDPHVVEETTVVVTFLEPVQKAAKSSAAKKMTFGMFADPSRRMSTLEDFKVAEYDDSRWDRD